MRLRSDEQLVALFRGGNNDAFRVIHDRYRQRLFAYTRQMLPRRQDAEDALQDVFVRAYGALLSSNRELALRAWLYRIAHNRCIDELRRPAPPAPELLELVRPPVSDPIDAAEQRESLRRLIEDVRRLPEQQRSALLMRELGGMSYIEVAEALGASVPAVKSLLVRARVGLAQALEARETACYAIREDLIEAHDRGVRPTGMARRHMRDCAGCREFRGQLRGTSRQFAALLPALGPIGVLAKVLGFGGSAGGGAAASGSAAAGGGAATGGGAAVAGGIIGSSGTAASVGVLAAGTGHVATLLATVVVATGGAAEIQHTITPARHGHSKAAAVKPSASKHPASRVAASTPVPSSAPQPVELSQPAPVAPAAPEAASAAPPPVHAAAVARPKHHPAASADSALPPKPEPNFNTPYGNTSNTTPGGPTTTGSGSQTDGTGTSAAGTQTNGNGTGADSGSTGSIGSTGSPGTPSTPSGGSTSGGGSGDLTGSAGSGGTVTAPSSASAGSSSSGSGTGATGSASSTSTS